MKKKHNWTLKSKHVFAAMILVCISLMIFAAAVKFPVDAVRTAAGYVIVPFQKGINAVGPCPADSVFHIGKSGKFDAILSMYHDQGHIACKTFDFQKSVTITWGLPFIRGSVDHGTAFDIAGKGIADCVSLIESTKVCVEYAVRKHERETKK